MLIEKIEEMVRELKEVDEKLVGVIVTDDSGLKIYPPSSSESLDTLASALSAMISKIRENASKIGLDEVKTVALRVSDYVIIIIPNTATNTIIIRRR